MGPIGSAESRLVIIRGNSGSGKSVLAKAIRDARPRGIAILGHDQLRREILHLPDRPGAMTVDYYDLSARFVLDRGLHLVIEGILHEEIYGDMLRALVADHRGVTRAYRYDLSFEQTLERHRTKDLAHVVTDEKLRSWYRESDPLHGVDETVIAPDSSLAATTELVLSDCGWEPVPATPATGGQCEDAAPRRTA